MFYFFFIIMEFESLFNTLFVSFGFWCFVIPFLFFFFLLLSIIWINLKLWDIRDSFEELINKIEEKEKNSWN